MILKELGHVSRTVLKITISLLLLAWFLLKADRQQMVNAFLSIPAWLWPTLFSMYILSQVLSSTRWYLLARILGFKSRWLTYLNYYFSGMFFNLFLPTSIGGDVIKVFFISRGGGGREKVLATYSVLADRFFGLAALMLLGAGAVLLHDGIFPEIFYDLLLCAGTGVILVLCFMPLFEKLIGGHLGETVRRAIQVLLVFWRYPAVLAAGIGFSLIIQTLCIMMCVLAGQAMAIQVPVSFYFAAFPLVALMTMLPVSFNGIGIREGGFVYFLGLQGVPAGQAVMLSLVFFAVQVAASLVGGIVYSSGGYKRTGI